MNISANNIELLLEEVKQLYSIERTVSSLLPQLKSETHHLRVQQGLRVEEEENIRQCERLAALIEILKPIQKKAEAKLDTSEQLGKSVQLFKTFSMRHKSVGYDTSILVAEVMGRMDILQTLQFCVRNESQIVKELLAA